MHELMIHNIEGTKAGQCTDARLQRRNCTQRQYAHKKIGNGKIKDLPENRRVDFALFESRMQQKGVVRIT